MAWEYLNDSRWNIRYKIISSYLKDKIKDKVILDINCGIPTLYNYLEGFSVYYANFLLNWHSEDFIPLFERSNRLPS